MRKKPGAGLVAKSRKRLAKSAFFGICLFLCLYILGKEAADYLTVGSEDAYLSRDRVRQEFADYVRAQGVKADDYASIEAFRREHALRQIVIIRHGEIILYAGERGGLFRSADYEELQVTPNMDVHFADGTAEVYLGKFDNPVLGTGISFLAAVLGMLAGIAYFSESMREDVKHLQKLQKEVAVISRGDFEGQVTIEGEDEIAQLARDLDRMRAELRERREKEAELREAEKKMVLGMSHDLRTPLTALITYLEIARRQGAEGTKYLDKASQKAGEIQLLANEMFEHFLVSTVAKGRELSEEPAETAFSDYLSEICAVLSERGFSVNAQGVENLTGWVLVDDEYLGRIVNNLLSNFLKYADRNEEVGLLVDESEHKIRIRFENVISPLVGNGRESTGIGTKNIAIMMKSMGGVLVTETAEGRYVTELHFPKKEAHHESAAKQDPAG